MKMCEKSDGVSELVSEQVSECDGTNEWE